MTTDIDAGAGMATTNTLAVKERHVVLKAYLDFPFDAVWAS
jgi:hypothetical protein